MRLAAIAVLSGAHQVWHAAGWLEGGLVISYEKFIMDLDHCGAMMTLFQGLATDEEALARDSYMETGPGKNFLPTANTLRHYATANFEPDIPEPGTYEAWVEGGGPTLEQRAHLRWKRILEEYKPPPMDAAARGALDDYKALQGGGKAPSMGRHENPYRLVQISPPRIMTHPQSPPACRSPVCQAGGTTTIREAGDVKSRGCGIPGTAKMAWTIRIALAQPVQRHR